MDIVVNGIKRALTTPGLSYEDVVRLARGPGHEGKVFTVVYRGSGRSGELTPGDSITAEQGMVFNVADTSRA